MDMQHQNRQTHSNNPTTRDHPYVIQVSSEIVIPVESESQQINATNLNLSVKPALGITFFFKSTGNIHVHISNSFFFKQNSAVTLTTKKVQKMRIQHSKCKKNVLLFSKQPLLFKKTKELSINLIPAFTITAFVL
jgi:hypothetical protein